MKVVGLGNLQTFTQRHLDARPQIDAWVREAIAAEWRSRHDIAARYANAAFVRDNRVVFAIHSNAVRLDVKVSYPSRVVLIVRIGTSAESNTWRF
jgi:mRNA interferase HigB